MLVANSLVVRHAHNHLNVNLFHLDIHLFPLETKEKDRLRGESSKFPA